MLVALWHFPARLATFGFALLLLASVLHLLYIALVVSLDSLCAPMRCFERRRHLWHSTLCVVYVYILAYNYTLFFAVFPSVCFRHANHFAAK
jgi:hypothetical protein